MSIDARLRALPSAEILDQIRGVVGPKGVVAADAAVPYLTEWRRRWRGETPLIVVPASVEEVARIVAICASNGVAITPQGGNTGLVGGQIPFGSEVLLSMKRLNRIRDVSPLDNTLTVDAGVTLAEAQGAARDAKRLFPLSIGSEGSCQIGGVISTNAGGVNVLRYGNTRDLVLGLEAVLPSGEIWNGLKRLRKDNTGYDLKQLFIGGEGTLGVVTGAVLKLFPLPTEFVTVFAGVRDPSAAVTLLSLAQTATGGLASSFELLSRLCLDLVLAHIPSTRDPLDAPHPWYVLAEFSSGAAGLRETVETFLASALAKGLIEDAALAENQTQSKSFWRLRHSIAEAIAAEGAAAHHDVSVATADLPRFLMKADAAVAKLAPGARIPAFGHIGDGNVHYDVLPPKGAQRDALSPIEEAIEQRIYDVIAEFQGSISAEHGVGRQRKDDIAKRKSSVELSMMRAIKKALDPQGIMNPGKML
jgi:FAD/FMN-containing dehydrogenase